MPKEKLAVTIEKDFLERLDRMVAEGRYPSRSRAAEQAIEDRLENVERARLPCEPSARVGSVLDQGAVSNPNAFIV